MGLGQTMLTVGSIILLSMVLLNVNNNFSATQQVLVSSKYNIMAISLAASMLDEIMQKSFDENTIDNYLASSNLLSTIGPDAETYSYYDDIDDYNGYYYNTEPNDQTHEKFLPGPKYKVWVDVYYIDPTNPNVEAHGKTFHKKVTVNVFMPDFTDEVVANDTIKLEKVFSYFIFR